MEEVMIDEGVRAFKFSRVSLNLHHTQLTLFSFCFLGHAAAHGRMLQSVGMGL